MSLGGRMDILTHKSSIQGGFLGDGSRDETSPMYKNTRCERDGCWESKITEPCLVVDVRSPAEGAQPPSAFSGNWWHPRPPPWEVTATWLRPRRHPGRYVRLSTRTSPSGVWFPVLSPTKPLNPVSLILLFFWATLLEGLKENLVLLTLILLL